MHEKCMLSPVKDVQVMCYERPVWDSLFIIEVFAGSLPNSFFGLLKWEEWIQSWWLQFIWEKNGRELCHYNCGQSEWLSCLSSISCVMVGSISPELDGGVALSFIFSWMTCLISRVACICWVPELLGRVNVTWAWWWGCIQLHFQLDVLFD